MFLNVSKQFLSGFGDPSLLGLQHINRWSLQNVGMTGIEQENPSSRLQRLQQHPSILPRSKAYGDDLLQVLKLVPASGSEERRAFQARSCYFHEGDEMKLGSAYSPNS